MHQGRLSVQGLIRLSMPQINILWQQAEFTMKPTLILIALISLFLVACSEEVTATAVAELPTNTAEPTLTNTAVPTNTPTLEPTETFTLVPTETPLPTATTPPTSITNYETFESYEQQLLFEYPEGWWILDDNDTNRIMIGSHTNMMTSESFDEGIVMVVLIEEIGNSDPDLDEMIRTLSRLVIDSGLVKDFSFDATLEEFTIDDREIGYTDYSATLVQTDEPIILWTGAVIGYESVAFIYGFTPPDVYEASGKEQMLNILETLQLDAEISRVQTGEIFFVDSYDSQRDTQQDVEAAMKVAREEGKQILLIVGDMSCSECWKLESYISDTTELMRRLTEQFVIVKVYGNDNGVNEVFLGDYPEIEWFPHFFVLENDGTFVGSYDTRELQTTGFYDFEKFVEFITQFAP